MNGLLELMAVICREQMEEFAILQQKIEHAKQMSELEQEYERDLIAEREREQ